MKADILVAEIGSTTTVVNAFSGIGTSQPKFIGQGQASTTVANGNVTIGLKNAINDLSMNLSVENVEWETMLATSSAAGGLRMSVHGLVYDMTVRSAREAALGAGGILKYVTAGKLMRSDIAKIKEHHPNIILVAGGLDYGERETTLINFEKLADACPDIPFIYAGNIQNQEEIKLIAEEKNVKVYIVENCYPKVDVLNIEPTRRIIQEVFEEHITGAPGMAEVRSMVGGKIMPTPGAVMEAARLLYNELGDILVFDVGGATTDLHSVTPGSNEINEILISPEPFAKRTVEGDLGVFVNIPHIVEKVGMETLAQIFPNAEELITNAEAIPKADEQKQFIEYITQVAIVCALDRHAGKLIDIFGPTGKRVMANGKDLTAVKYLIGTGGALTRLPKRKEIMSKIIEPVHSSRLSPRPGVEILIDNHYIMASLGVMAVNYPEDSLKLLKQSLKIF